MRGYKDSNCDGKGDLQGLISKLDYLKDLGITGIWLMPVTDSADKDHGYNVKNYRTIQTDYGSMADFDQLLVQAHARGIGPGMPAPIPMATTLQALWPVCLTST